jgi:hypothetical protein
LAEFSTAKTQQNPCWEQGCAVAAYHAVESKLEKGPIMATQLWQVGLWQDGGHGAYSHGQFCSVFSVKLFVELSRPRPDFVDILAPSDASTADLDWIRAELSRADACPGRLSFTTDG